MKDYKMEWGNLILSNCFSFFWLDFFFCLTISANAISILPLIIKIGHSVNKGACTCALKPGLSFMEQRGRQFVLYCVGD